MLPRIPYIRPSELSKEEEAFVRQIVGPARLLLAGGFVVFVAAAYITLSGCLNLPQVTQLDTPFDRILFAARYFSLQLIGFLLTVYIVIGYRLYTPAMDPTYKDSRWEATVQGAKNVLTNTLESGFVFAFSSLLTAVDLTPAQCAQIIPAMNILYLFARIAFLLGYPKRRGFGYVIINCLLTTSVGFNFYGLFRLYSASCGSPSVIQATPTQTRTHTSL